MATAKKNWILILFSLPFTAVGIGVFFFSVVPTIYDCYRMQDWQLVNATLLAAELHVSRGDDSTTYNATASYRYVYAGQEYQSQRVAIATSSDNIGSFQQDLGHRLERAYQQQETIQVWVNPQQPAEAIIDRSLRLPFIGFKMIFVLLFGGVGVGILYFCLRKDDGFVALNNSGKPWLARREWANNRITSNQQLHVWVAWGIAIIWNLISLPAALMIPGAVNNGNYPVLMASIFPLAGIGLLYWAIKVTRDWRRYGEVFLRLDPFPGSLGGDVGGSLVIPLRTAENLHFYVQLSCINSYVSGTGKNRETRERMIWQDEGIAEVIAVANHTTLKFLFHVPHHLPASEAHSDNYNHWRVSVESKNPSVPFSRQYSIPVYATAEKSQLQTTESGEHPVMQQLEEDSLESVCNLEQIPGGVELYFRPLRNSSTKLTLIIFGIIFGGSGLFILNLGDAPVFFSAMFLVGGSFCAGLGIYGLGNSLRVRLDQQELRYQRRLFGFIVKHLQIPRQDVLHVQLAESYSSQTGNKHEKVFAINAVLKSGKKIHVAESLRGEGVAELMLETLHLLCGVKVNPETITNVNRRR